MDNHIHHISHPDHMLVLHDQWREQEKPIDCKVCSKPISPGSAYYICEISDCKFVLHRSCSNLPGEIENKQKLEGEEKAVSENDSKTNLSAKSENFETEKKHDKKNGETSNIEVKDDTDVIGGESKREDKKRNLPVDSSTAKEKSKRSHQEDENGTADQDKTKDESEEDESEDESIKDSNGPRLRDLGGLRSVVDELKTEVILHLNNQLSYLGIKPVSGILLHGPSGCGKTKLGRAIANETSLPFHYISCTKLVSRKSSSAEKKIQKLFAEAYKTAPSIVFIDEIHEIAKDSMIGLPSLVTPLLTCMDEYNTKSSADSTPSHVFVIGATNSLDEVDPDLRKPGRFNREIVIDPPDENARIDILTVLTRNLILEDSVDLKKLSKSTPEFVGADLEELVNKARTLAIKRIIDKKKSEMSREYKSRDQIDEWWKQPYWLPKHEEMENLCIHMADFEEAIKMIRPPKSDSKVNGCFLDSLFGPRTRELSSIPDVKWEDVGGLDSLRKEFDRYIIRRIKHPEVYAKFGIDLDTGFLLHGPPGCGKTLIAKAVANEAGANFIHIKGPELLNCLLGASEQAIRDIFKKARESSPCVIFFDEVDSLTAKRGLKSNCVGDTILNQLLIELDGGDKRNGVFVIGATNRPDAVDAAALRPGRFGKSMYVPLPDVNGRQSILKALSRKKPVDASVDFHAIARMKACEKLSGADLAALINEAALAALEENLESCSNPTTPTIKTTHFEQALQKIKPSVSGTFIEDSVMLEGRR